MWKGLAVSLGRPHQNLNDSALATQLSIDGEAVATVHFADQLRPDARSAVDALRAEGLDAMILSGDRAEAVAPVARALGMTAQTGMSPQDKLAGSASDVGKNAADCIFLGDRMMPVVQTLRIARRTQAIVRQNFALAIGYNVVAVPLAFLGHVTPLVAALAMSGSSLLVVGNAMRLKRAIR